MIARSHIIAWSENAPWSTNDQVEQDMVIERGLVQIFENSVLSDNLAFRGGTALHKLYLKPQARYSEDIDLVQIKSGPIKPILDKLETQLNFLGTKRRVKQNINNNTVIYRFSSEIPPIVPIRLKIEINCREHFNVLGLEKRPFQTESGWYTGGTELSTFQLEELLGTKLRALYQRNKGRDLFDLYLAFTRANPNPDHVIRCFKEYMAFVVNKPPTQKQFIQNLTLKMDNEGFLGDMVGLLRPGVRYDANAAFEVVIKELIEKL